MPRWLAKAHGFVVVLAITALAAAAATLIVATVMGIGSIWGRAVLFGSRFGELIVRF